MSQSVSIIVPVYNDPDGIRAMLSVLVDQTYPDDRYETLVVDNDSDDTPPDVTERSPSGIRR